MPPDCPRQDNPSASAPTRLRHQVNAVIEQFVHRITHEPPCPSHSSRRVKMNRLMMGLQSAGMVVIASTSPQERLALLLHLAEVICIDGNQPTLLISAEFSSFEIAHSLIDARANLEFEDVCDAVPIKSELQKFHRATQEVANSQLFVEDAKDLSMDALRATARRHRKEHGIALIAIDAMGLQRGQDIAWNAAAIESLALELDLPILVTADLNRLVLH